MRGLLLIISFLFSAYALGEDQIAQTRALCWYNKDTHAFGWLVFKEDYTPVWYCFQTPDGKEVSSDAITDGSAMRISIRVELSPLEIDIKGADFGYSARFTHGGKKVDLHAIDTAYLELPNGSFVASMIVKDIGALPHSFEQAKVYSVEQLKKGISDGRLAAKPTALAQPKTEDKSMP